MRDFVIPAVISYQFQVSNNRQSKVREGHLLLLPGLNFMEKSLVIQTDYQDIKFSSPI